jgi:hypothetical protein
MRKKVASAGAASWWWTLEFTAWILVAWGLGLGGAATDLQDSVAGVRLKGELPA